MVELASDLKGRYNVTILDGEDKGPQQLRAIRCICGMARASVYPAFPCIPRMPYGTISAVVLDCSLDKSTVRDGDSVLVPVRLPTHSALPTQLAMYQQAQASDQPDGLCYGCSFRNGEVRQYSGLWSKRDIVDFVNNRWTDAKPIALVLNPFALL